MSSPSNELLEKKFDHLIGLLRNAGSAVLAFSGGVDSSLLLKALQVSGIRALAVTATSAAVPAQDVQYAQSLARELGVPHLMIAGTEFANERFAANPPDRCFHCKDSLFLRLNEIAKDQGYASVLDGSNSDDASDYRPGKKATELHAVRSPLVESGFTKQDIRALSRDLGLPAWDRPASPCLSSRIPYGQRITEDDLRKIGQAEEFLRSLGIGTVRVRLHKDLARIEVLPGDLDMLLSPETRLQVIDRFRTLGFSFVSLDLEGYRLGSMNRVLTQAPGSKG